MIDKYLRRKIPIGMDKFRIPVGESENMFFEDPINKQSYLEDQKEFKKTADIIKNNF